ncbi:MAG: hypothetical protein QF381_03145 [Nitrososphaerales archaeon]|jgi:hypothetical protein|nr:hypothetical protein [Nitrososphaerales archaeon]|tara:strand:- start:47 stop:199 length:153 start_codon:yes stop_codon:yes gene_type:complete
MAKNAPLEPSKPVKIDSIPNMRPVVIPKITLSQKILSVVFIKMTTAQIDD